MMLDFVAKRSWFVLDPLEPHALAIVRFRGPNILAPLVQVTLDAPWALGITVDCKAVLDEQDWEY